MARIFVIEDDEGFRTQLELLLEHAGHEVSHATDFSRTVTDTLAFSPDLILLDLGLPGTDGVFIVRELRQESHLPILVLTSRTTELDELTSLSMGADDFVPKTTNPQIILAHVDALLRRSGATSDALLAWNGVTLDLARSEVARNDQSIELTKNEQRILGVLMRARGAIVSRERLMEALWATDSFVDDNTLTVNINRLRQALGRIGAGDLVVTHRGQGYAVVLPKTNGATPNHPDSTSSGDKAGLQ